MRKKVVIVGAGPAGLFAANELCKDYKVMVIEKRNVIGGSGLVIDGKLNFHPKIGGNLLEFVDEKEADRIIKRIEEIFEGLGVEKPRYNKEKAEQLKKEAFKYGIEFIPAKQLHIGSDRLPSVMKAFQEKLESNGVKFLFNTKVVDFEFENKSLEAIVTEKNEKIHADIFVLAFGRCNELVKKLTEKGINVRYNPIDVGVRVEIPNEVMSEIIEEYAVWDPKFRIRTKAYDDLVRTFCVSPSGYVVKENYNDELVGVNGHSLKEKGKSNNTNFAFLVTVGLTEPLENTTEYGINIVRLANRLGKNKPLIQRLGDLKRHRRSTWERIERSYVEPTLKDVTPGDISMALPARIVTNILEGLEKLGKIVKGIDSDDTLLYAPEVKFYAMRIITDRYLKAKGTENVFVAGDGAGVSRGIVGAAATGMIAAKGIKHFYS
ncbi:MAG TPA: FAD-dependent oxidoreductase [Candidatus Pacearchaeota archaeon]|nr:FAD-dependent oxidoreductase [Candidatus Pacearchaeota archaeon]